MASRRSHAPTHSRTYYHPQHHTGCVSPHRGTNFGGGIARTHSCAASQLAVGFHYIGPAPRNPQLKLNLLVVRGCVATARRHSLLRLPFFCRAIWRYCGFRDWFGLLQKIEHLFCLL